MLPSGHQHCTDGAMPCTTIMLSPAGCSKQGVTAARARRAISHSLRPQQVSYVLPGYGYKEADLRHINQQALSSMDFDLLELAWEVSISTLCPKYATLLSTCFASFRVVVRVQMGQEALRASAITAAWLLASLPEKRCGLCACTPDAWPSLKAGPCSDAKISRGAATEGGAGGRAGGKGGRGDRAVQCATDGRAAIWGLPAHGPAVCHTPAAFGGPHLVQAGRPPAPALVSGSAQGGGCHAPGSRGCCCSGASTSAGQAFCSPCLRSRDAPWELHLHQKGSHWPEHIL